jgi:hypothetical protein
MYESEIADHPFPLAGGEIVDAHLSLHPAARVGRVFHSRISGVLSSQAAASLHHQPDDCVPDGVERGRATSEKVGNFRIFGASIPRDSSQRKQLTTCSLFLEDAPSP